MLFYGRCARWIGSRSYSFERLLRDSGYEIGVWYQEQELLQNAKATAVKDG